MDSSDLRLVRGMLQAAAAETAPAEVKRRALASLGLLALAPAVALTSSTAAATSAGSAGVGAVGKALWYQAWYVKAALMLGLGSTGAAVETAFASKTGDQESTEPSAIRTTTKRVAPATLAPTARAPLVVPSVPSSEAQRSPDRGPQSPSSAPAATSRGGSRPLAVRQPVPIPGEPDVGPQIQRASSIRDEIRLLDKAREELARGRTSAAARTIDDYLSRHPQGELRVEAAAVKRELLRHR